LRWLAGPSDEETDRVIDLKSPSCALAGYRFPREVIAVAVCWYLRPIAGRVACRPGGVDEIGGEGVYPPEDRHVIDGDAALSQQAGSVSSGRYRSTRGRRLGHRC
jgi:hypothetical protein